MNIRTDENIFLAETSVVATETQDAATGVDDAPKQNIAVKAKSERFLLCTKSQDMVANVRRSFAGQVDVIIDVADQTLIEMAESTLDVIADHCLVAVEADPDRPDQMAALRKVTSNAPAHVQFLAITPKELTISSARDLLDAGVIEVLPMMALRGAQTAASNPDASNGDASQKGMVIAVAQTRGGIGATTLAINLASMLSAPKSRRDKTVRPRVAILDLDFQNGDAAAALDIEDNGVLIEMLKAGGTPDAAFVKQAMVTYKEQFDVLPTPLEFAPFDAFKPEKMALMIAELRTKYDYVILGLPRSMVLWIAPILACADQMLLLTDTSVTGTRQARRLIDFYTEDNPSMPLEIIISKEKKPFSQPKAVKEAANFLDKSFEIWLPYDGRAAGKAADRGVPMVEAAKRSAVVKPLKKIVAMLDVIKSSGKRREA